MHIGSATRGGRIHTGVTAPPLGTALPLSALTVKGGLLLPS